LNRPIQYPISGKSQLFTWSSFRQVVEECPDALSTDRLHFDYPEMSVGVNVRIADFIIIIIIYTFINPSVHVTIKVYKKYT
jgi:hypothetical protein